MGRSRTNRAGDQFQGPRDRVRLCGLLFLAAALGASGATGALLWLRDDSADQHLNSESMSRPKPAPRSIVWDPHKWLALLDIGSMNLLCALDLPGAPRAGTDTVATRLDKWADVLRQETARRVEELAGPAPEGPSNDARIRASVLARVLRDQAGIALPGRPIQKTDFRDPANIFIHGCAMQGGGTSLSAPVVCVAVGRRLGYPLRLAGGQRGLRVYWHDRESGESFEVGKSAEDTRSPDSPRQPGPLTRPAGRRGKRKGPRLLTKREELALFVALRGRCLLAAGRIQEAQVAFAHAHRLAPRDPVYLAALADVVDLEAGPTRLAGRRDGKGMTPGPKDPRYDPMAELRRIMELNARNRRLPGTFIDPNLPAGRRNEPPPP